MSLGDAPVCGSQDEALHSGPSDVASPHTHQLERHRFSQCRGTSWLLPAAGGHAGTGTA